MDIPFPSVFEQQQERGQPSKPLFFSPLEFHLGIRKISEISLNGTDDNRM